MLPCYSGRSSLLELSREHLNQAELYLEHSSRVEWYQEHSIRVELYQDRLYLGLCQD